MKQIQNRVQSNPNLFCINIIINVLSFQLCGGYLFVCTRKLTQPLPTKLVGGFSSIYFLFIVQDSFETNFSHSFGVGPLLLLLLQATVHKVANCSLPSIDLTLLPCDAASVLHPSETVGLVHSNLGRLILLFLLHLNKSQGLHLVQNKDQILRNESYRYRKKKMTHNTHLKL